VAIRCPSRLLPVGALGGQDRREVGVEAVERHPPPHHLA
jgi:hypothetical protein